MTDMEREHGGALSGRPTGSCALARALALAALALSAPLAAQAQSAEQTFRITAPGVEPAGVADVRADLAWAETRIADLLGRFPGTAAVEIYPDREAFSAALRDAWGIPETACWMVGAADDHHLKLLSPGTWGEEACEHDPADGEHRRMLIAHEAVHVYHGQVNPSEDIGLLEEIGWFVEGLATWASGQLETAHAGRAKEALALGEGPEQLADAWSGPYRYGVAGSLVAYIDRRWGRDTLRTALKATTQAELLAILDSTEAGLLADWARWVTDP
jgi:predicted metal-dependent hydrolase